MNEDKLIEYSLGLLGDSESVTLEPAIERHPQTADFVRQTMDSLAVMVLDLPPVAIPEYATDNLLKRIRALPDVNAPVAPGAPTQPQVDRQVTPSQATASQAAGGLELEASPVYEPPYEVVYDPDIETTRPLRKGASWFVTVLQSLLIAGAVLGGIWAFVLSPMQQDLAIGQLLEDYSAQPGAVTQPLVDDDGISLGVLVRRSEGDVLVVLEAAPPRGQVYQAWQVALDQESTSLGTASERAFVVPEGTEIGASFALTLEPDGGSNQPTTPFLTRLVL
ncbi:MAG: anti-sigma factor [Deinococcota bacterium]